MNIKVALIGQYLGQSSIIASFQDSQDGKWASRLFNPREHARHLLKDDSAKECFVLWYDEVNGWNYGIILHSPTDNRDGYVMTVVCTGDCIIDSGESVLDTLQQLSQLFLNNDFQSPRDLQERCKDKVAQIAAQIGLTHIQLAQIDFNRRGNAFRIARSKDDLINIFQYPTQPEYYKYDRVFLISSANEIELARAGYVEIKEPVREVYNVTLPDHGNVSVNKYTIISGDTIELSYHKQYCEDDIHHIQINGRDNQFLRYQGNSIVISDAESAGVKFRRFIFLSVSSNNGTPINDVKLLPKQSTDAQQDKRKGGFSFPDGLKQYAIRLSAKGYEDIDVDLSDEDFNIGTKQVYMTATRMKISIQLKTNDGIKKGDVYVNTDDPLYAYLEHASRDCHPYITYDYPRDAEHKTPSKDWKARIKKASIGLVALLVVCVVYAVVRLIMSDSNPWSFTNKEAEITTDNTTPSNNGEDIEQDTIGASRDIIYLKKEHMWDKTQIQSQKYQRLCDYISHGQIDEIMTETWFENDSLVNDCWHTKDGKGIFEMLTSIKEKSDQKEKAKKAMKECSRNGKIQLSSLQKELQDIIAPVSKPNTSENERGTTEEEGT